MLRATILSFIALVSIASFSFIPGKLKAPPGTVILKDNLFIDQTEIANIHWREFEYWNVAFAKDTVTYNKMLPDTTVWSNNLPYIKFYYRHPSFNYYPLVGISYEQAIAFCKWRTDRVNELFAKDPSANPFPGKKYLYRLPTESEWELAAAGKLDVATYSYGYKKAVGSKGIWKGHRLFNYKSDTAKQVAFMSPVKSFLPNGYGVYTMIGNVSEMIIEKGVAKGGNYSLSLNECKIVSEQTYIKPEAWLGFRCVCEVKD